MTGSTSRPALRISERMVAVWTIGFAAGCGGPPAAPSGPPLGLNAQVVPLVSRPAQVPLGPAVLQVWGYTLINQHGPICEPLFGNQEGTFLTARVHVSAEGPEWVIRAEPRRGSAEIRFRQTGDPRVEGEVLIGTARGWLQDMARAPGEPGKQLDANFSADSTPSQLQGFASHTRPRIDGTMTGRIVYTDPWGGAITCPLVYWVLQPADGWVFVP